jgi:pimeloyl-ACP methyl ester carboxylesterase
MQRQVRGRTLGYDDRGQGEPVVLLHAFPFARGLWAGVADALAARRRVINVDARGFGESALRATGGTSAAYSIADLADDVAGLLDALDVPSAALLGMSMGGYTALAFAALHRARLSALVLADTRAAADTPDAQAKRDQAITRIHRDGAPAYLDDSLGRLLSPGAAPALLDDLRARAETRADSLTAALAAMRDRVDRTAELPAVRCPTLVIGGEQEQVIPPAEMQRMSAAIPGARFVAVPGAGHLAHLEAPRPFTAAVASFLDGRVTA